MGRVNPYALTDQDLAAMERRYIGPEQVRLNDIWRVDDVDGAEKVSRTFGGTDGARYCGLVIPTYRVGSLNPRSYRLRRDFPDREPRTDGPGFKEKGKYLWSKESRSTFYYPHGNRPEQMQDVSIPAFFIEGEFKSVSLKRVLDEAGIDALVIGLYGAHNWKGRKATGSAVTGPVNDFDDFEWAGRDVTICRDANYRTNSQVRSGMRDLALYLHLLSARPYFADTPELEGVNGFDDLAGLHGPGSVLEVLDSRQPAIKAKSAKLKISPEERKRRADELRKVAGQSTDALAADVLGNAAAKHLLKLWAEAGLSDEAVRLLIAWEAIAQGCDELDYLYADLYQLLYKSKGDEFEQTAMGGHILKASYRKKLSERIARLEAEQADIQITFAFHTSGSLDEFDNPLPSHVSLYSRGFVAEAMIKAESMHNFARHKKETRMEAIGQIVAEKTGVAYRKRPLPRKDKSKQIADGLQRVKGNLAATLERMKHRGDSERDQWLQVIEVLPEGLIDFIKAQGVTEYLESRGDLKKEEDIKVTSEHQETTSNSPNDSMSQQSENDGFGVTSKTPVSVADSTDEFAGFSETCTNLQPKSAKDDPVRAETDKELWARVEARAQAPPASLTDPPPEVDAAVPPSGFASAAVGQSMDAPPPGSPPEAESAGGVAWEF
jgi:hypothetical protein